MHFFGLVGFVLLLVAAHTSEALALCEDSDTALALALRARNRNTLCVCPLHCECYFRSKPYRVDCARQRLANINAKDVPTAVQLLDISDNLIAEITDGYFLGLSHVQYLLIARNAVHSVEPLALSGLRRLTVMDLSDNRLATLPPTLFSHTPRIRELRLAGNHLISVYLYNRPLPMIEASHLQELDVSRCKLAYLPAWAFAGVPRLLTLNVSSNQFLQIPTRAIATLKSLRYLYADRNPFNCDAGMAELTYLLKESNVTSSGLCEVPDPDPASSSTMTTSPPPVPAVGPLAPASASASAPERFARMMSMSLDEHTRKTKRMYQPKEDPDPNSDYDPRHQHWESVDSFEAWPDQNFDNTPAPTPTDRDRDRNRNRDRDYYDANSVGGAVLKREPFFKFDFANFFAAIIGFKIGFVSALVLFRGCNGRAPSQPLPADHDRDHATSARLLRPQPLRVAACDPESGYPPSSTSAPAALATSAEDPEDRRPETPPPAYHELPFTSRRAGIPQQPIGTV